MLGAARASVITDKGGAEVGPVPSLFLAAGNMDEISPFDPAYPASIAAGDWLLAIAMWVAADVSAGTFGAITGFSNLGASPYDANAGGATGNQVRLWIRGKTAAGTETGDETFTMSDANSVAAMARFTDVNTSSPIEGIQFAELTDNPHTIPTITSLGPNRLAVLILAISENQNPDATLTGGSGPAPVLIATAGTSGGADRRLAIYAVDMPTEGSISGYQQTVDFTTHQAGFLGFFVKPTGS